MKIKQILKEQSANFLDKISKNATKTLNYPKEKANELKDLIKFKIREKALKATKARLAENHKSLDDFSEEEIEIILSDEERKIIDDLKTKSLVVVLATLGINIFA